LQANFLDLEVYKLSSNSKTVLLHIKCNLGGSSYGSKSAENIHEYRTFQNENHITTAVRSSSIGEEMDYENQTDDPTAEMSVLKTFTNYIRLW